MQKIIVIDFGGQYNQLIARRVRDFNVCTDIMPCTTDGLVEKLQEIAPIGIIFTGGPESVLIDNSPTVDKRIFSLGIPVLGICYGAQLMAQLLGGAVKTASECEYGRTAIKYSDNRLFEGMEIDNICWMSHTDFIYKMPNGFEVLASTKGCKVAAMGRAGDKMYAVQFHPEVVHTVDGIKILKNFVYNICGATGDWQMHDFVQKQIAAIREKVGDKKVLCAFSGGVDSAVAATIVHMAIGDQLTCIFVDHGLLRKNEASEVMTEFKEKRGMNIIKADAGTQFLKALSGVTSPEKKRKIIGKEFINVFEQESAKLGKMDYLVQGTIYPDIIESGKGKSSTIKSHHNVGGLPEKTQFIGIIEPLRDLFKDEVRKVGYEVGLPEHIVMRQPFPGPGLGIRIIGNVTKAKVKVLQDADYIFREEIAKAGLNKVIWQYFAVLTGIKTVGVMGDARTYDNIVALRAVTSVDGMTADWADIPKCVMERISTRIINEVKGVNRIVYDVTSKPPSTIEWE